MDPRKLFSDDRLRGACSYCGGVPNTRDHVPSKVLLDEPYPNDLPVVDCCTSCNQGFSLDEEYLACFLSCVVSGSTDPAEQTSPKIARILRRKMALVARIQSSNTKSEHGSSIWMPEEDRVRSVLTKLARGHLAYEMSVPRIDEPLYVVYTPLHCLSKQDANEFLIPPDSHGYPEIGSRAFINMLVCGDDAWSEGYDDWNIVQPKKYEYLVSQSDGDFVRLLIWNYLACVVAWD
jgi:hypothetical protein